MRTPPTAIVGLLLAALTLAGCVSPAPTAAPPVATPAALPPATEPPAAPTVPAPSQAPTATLPAAAGGAAAGLRVVYLAPGGLTVWTEGQGPRPLAAPTVVERLRLSPDGRTVAYLGANAQGVRGVFAVDVASGQERLLLGDAYLQAMQPPAVVADIGFDPAGEALYLTTDQNDLHRVGLAEGSPARVLEAGQGGPFRFSPDGRWLVLYHPNELVLARPDGSEARVVFRYPQDFLRTRMAPELVWEPDSSGFRVVSASGPQGEPDAMTLWRVPVAGEPVREMSYAGPYGAHLSPDGRKVVYLFFQHTPIDVHVVAADGTDQLYGEYDPDRYPSLDCLGWAPDSQRFLLDLSEDGRFPVPYLASVGQAPVKLSDTDSAFAVAWVDAQRVLYVSQGGPAGDELRLQRIGEASVVLDVVSGAGFAFVALR